MTAKRGMSGLGSITRIGPWWEQADIRYYLYDGLPVRVEYRENPHYLKRVIDIHEVRTPYISSHNGKAFLEPNKDLKFDENRATRLSKEEFYLALKSFQQNPQVAVSLSLPAPSQSP